MDIWEWVYKTREELNENGHERLSSLMGNIPSRVCDDEHQEADAMFPEALSLARAVEHGWAEVFIRHWSLQSKLLHRSDVRGQLPEAVELFEFAQREQNQSCPHSVCVTQDLAVAYQLLDGKGYAAERLAVSEETLQRIDPTWGCFSCISSEHAQALIDSDRAEDAVAFVDRQRDELAKYHKGRSYDWEATSLLSDKAEALLAVGRFEESLKCAKDCAEKSREMGQAHRATNAEINIAVAHAAMGDVDACMEALPDWDVILKTPTHHQGVVRMLEELHRNGVYENTFRSSPIIIRLARDLEEREVNRPAIAASALFIRLALERGSPLVARPAIVLLKASLERLRVPHEDAKELEALCQQAEDEWAKALETELDIEAFDTLADIMPEFESPEDELAFLERLAARFPERVDVALAVSNIWDYLGHYDYAEALVVAACDANPDDSAALSALVRTGFGKGRMEALVTKLRAVIAGPGVLTTEARFHLGQVLKRRGEYKEALEQFVLTHEEDPDQLGCTLLIPQVLQLMGQYEDATTAWDAVMEARGDEIDTFWHWDRITSATCAGRWDSVRASAAVIGFEFEGEGPIDLPMESVVIQLESPNVQLWAQRNSPVSARIVELSGPEDEQHYHDVVVFDAEPKNQPAEGEETPSVFVYGQLATIEPGCFRASLEIDGFHPGDVKIAVLREKLDAIGTELQVRSDDTYKLPDSQGKPITALYAFLGIATAADPAKTREILEDFAATCEHGIFFPALLMACGDEEAAEAQRAQMNVLGVS